MIREPMTPAEADAAWRELERLCPWASLTSGTRSEQRNAEVGGNPLSKHLWRLGMARDYAAPTHELRDEGMQHARELGFWVKAYDWGFHTQGLPPGPVPDWWRDKYERGG